MNTLEELFDSYKFNAFSQWWDSLPSYEKRAMENCYEEALEKEYDDGYESGVLSLDESVIHGKGYMEGFKTAIANLEKEFALHGIGRLTLNNFKKQHELV